MFCKFCGKEIADDSTFCPNCGNSVSNVSPAVLPSSPSVEEENSQNNKFNTFAIIGIVLVGISFFLALWGIVAIAGIVISIIGMQQIKVSHEKGKQLTIASIILGAISLVYTFVVLMSVM